VRSLRMASGSEDEEEVGEVGCRTASSMVESVDGARSAGSGGAGAWRVERHIALWEISIFGDDRDVIQGRTILVQRWRTSLLLLELVPLFRFRHRLCSSVRSGHPTIR
jgi:hypothetical protein